MISNLELSKQELIKDLLEKQESGFLKTRKIFFWRGWQIKYLKKNNELSFITNENNLMV